jgi:hypothetical protein
MRDLLNIIQPLFETPAATVDELESMKAVIAGKIKQLPADAETAKALREIEDLLTHVNVGGRSGIIGKELDSIADPTVTAAQKMLARYILSLDMTPEQRTELFTLWREDKLVDRKKLLTKGKRTIAEVITKYNENPAIKELVDDLMSVAALGQGKGEFALSVLSKNIAKPQKGDLVVDGTKVEVKTTDGGAGRFTDQEVRPGAGFEQVARQLAALLAPYQAKATKSGPNLDNIVNIYSTISKDAEKKEEADNIINSIEQCISLIFQGQDVGPIVNAIKAGNVNSAKQEYAKTSFNYYMDKKEDEGVLYINLTKDPISLIWFADADDLTASGLRLHAGTVYITSVSDVRLPYPQMEIVDTNQGNSVGGSTASADIAVSQERVADIDQEIADITKPSQGIRPPGVEAPRAKRVAPSEPRAKR